MKSSKTECIGREEKKYYRHVPFLASANVLYPFLMYYYSNFVCVVNVTRLEPHPPRHLTNTVFFNPHERCWLHSFLNWPILQTFWAECCTMPALLLFHLTYAFWFWWNFFGHRNWGKWRVWEVGVLSICTRMKPQMLLIY